MKRLIILMAFSGLLLTGGMAQEANKPVRNKEQQRTQKEVKAPSQQQVESAQNQNRYEYMNREQKGDQKLQKKQMQQQKSETGNMNQNSYRSTVRRTDVAAARSHNAQGAVRKAPQANKASKGKR